jgi:hypothetical protein
MLSISASDLKHPNHMNHQSSNSHFNNDELDSQSLNEGCKLKSNKLEDNYSQSGSIRTIHTAGGRPKSIDVKNIFSQVNLSIHVCIILLNKHKSHL